MNKKIIFAFSLLVLALPAMALATPTLTLPPQPTEGTITAIWPVILNILNFIWPLFVGITIIMFIYAGFLFVTANGEPGKIKEARTAVVWAIVGIVVAVASFSIYSIVSNAITPTPTGLPSGSPCTIGAVPEQCATGVCTGLCP